MRPRRKLIRGILNREEKKIQSFSFGGARRRRWLLKSSSSEAHDDRAVGLLGDFARLTKLCRPILFFHLRLWYIFLFLYISSKKTTQLPVKGYGRLDLHRRVVHLPADFNALGHQLPPTNNSSRTICVNDSKQSILRIPSPSPLSRYVFDLKWGLLEIFVIFLILTSV